MLVSLNKNVWLWEWIKENWEDDLFKILNQNPPYYSKPNGLIKEVATLLKNKGYKAATNGKDIIIVMKEEEFIFLKLKYS